MLLPNAILSILTLLFLDVGVSKARDEDAFCLQSTPDLSSFAEWTLDLRTAVQKADLPLVGAGREYNLDDTTVKKVLFIGIDGLRASAIGMLPLPNFRRLERMGTYSYWAEVQSEAVVKSGPGWASMFTGVQPNKHLVDSNSDLTDISSAYPTVFKVVKDTYPNKKLAASVSWHPLIDEIIDHQDPTVLDAKYKASTDETMAEQVKQWILSKEYDFIFADFDDCDAVGHSNGFDPYLPDYRQAVQKTDALVGQLLDSLLTVSKDEEWLIILTSDHGGHGTNHGPQDEYNLRIPLLVASNSPRVNIGQMSIDDPGSHLDVLPTIIHFFNGGSCVDSSYEFEFEGENRDCTWVAEKKSKYCKFNEVSAMCPNTCGSCDTCEDNFKYKMHFNNGGSCVDSSYEFGLDGKIRDCTWVEKKINYCKFKVAKQMCPITCGKRRKTCKWVQKDLTRCFIDGMLNACRKTCNNCNPKYDVDGQVFGFVDYERIEKKILQCKPIPKKCGCGDQKQADYRGTIATTISGRTCQRWDSQDPQSHSRTPEKYPTSDLDENFCRNPDNEQWAWCYTTDPKKRFEKCDIPGCSAE